MSASIDQNLKINMIETLTRLCGQMENEENIPPQQEMNSANNMKKAAFGNNDAIYQFLTAIQSKVEALSNNNSNVSFTKTPSSDNQELPMTINPNTGKSDKRYCWSHVCCSHWSLSYKNKKVGHKDEPSFKVRIFGSDKNCLPNVQK